MTSKNKKITKHAKAKLIISNFLFSSYINWPKEIKMAYKLIDMFSKVDTIILKQTEKKPTLSWFLTDIGLKFIAQKLVDKNVSTTENLDYNVSDTNFGEDRIIPKQNNTSKDFLN